MPYVNRAKELEELMINCLPETKPGSEDIDSFIELIKQLYKNYDKKEYKIWTDSDSCCYQIKDNELVFAKNIMNEKQTIYSFHELIGNLDFNFTNINLE